MKTQVMIVVALLIPVALSSNSDMVVEAQLGPGDCYHGCTTGCVQRDRDQKTSKCEHHQCAKRCGRGKYTL
ncbi:unnamed protein product [Brassica oleracea]